MQSSLKENNFESSPKRLLTDQLPRGMSSFIVIATKLLNTQETKKVPIREFPKQ
jgi:hypothetical protein